MATQVQFRRGTTAQNNSFTGASGEISFDTDILTIRVHDGSLAGGYELARADLSNTGLSTENSSFDYLNATSGLYVAGVSTFVGNVQFDGDITLGNATVDNIIFNGDVNSNIIPNADDTYDLGSLSQQWRNIYINGTADIDQLTVSGVSTFTGTVDANGDLDVDGHTELDDVNVSGMATIQNLDVQGDFDVYSSTATFHNDVAVSKNLFINGNLSIGGTSSIVISEELVITDKEIVLGFTTDAFGNDISTDDTANGGGISIASTEGNPLVDFVIAGIHTHETTYKDIIWIKEGTLGAGTTDAWHFNYAVGIGSTQVPNGTRFAVSNIQFTDNLISSPQLSISGVSTFAGNIDANGNLDVDGHTELDDVNVSGIITAASAALTSAVVGGATTFTEDLVVQGDARITGILTIGTSSVTIDGSEDTITIGTGVTLTNLGDADYSGIVTASKFSGNIEGNVNSTGVSTFTTLQVGSAVTITDSGDANYIGVITAFQIYANEQFYGNVSGNVVGNLDGNVNGNLSGNVNSSGISTFGELVVGTVSINSNNNGIVTATTFTGNLTGNVTGDVNGDVTGDLTGEVNAAAFDTNSAGVVVTGVATATTFDGNLTGNVTGEVDAFAFDTNPAGVVVTGIATATTFDGNLTGEVNATAFDTNDDGIVVTGIVTTTELKVGTAITASSGIVTATTFSGDLSGNATTATALETAREFTVSGDVATASGVSFDGSGNADLPVTLSNSFSANTSGIITATEFSTGSQGIGINTNTISGPAAIFIDPATVGDNTGIVRIKGDLYVDGTQTILNSTQVEIADFVVGIATTAITDVAADGAGLQIGPDNTILYDHSNTALKSSENFNLASSKTYKINGSNVLSSTTLGSGVVNSSLTSVGTLGQLNVSGVTTATTLNSTNGTITNLSGTIGTVTTLGSTNGTITNLSSTNLSGTIGTVTTLTSTNGTITNLSSTNLSGTIGTVTTLTSTNGTVTNLSGTIGTVTTLQSTNGTVTNLSGTIGTVTNLSSTNLSGTIGTVTTLTSTNGTVTNLSGTIGTITTINGTNGTITNLGSTNLSGTIGTITTLTSTNGTITNLSSTNLSGTIGTVTTLTSTNGTVTNLSGTIGTVTTLTSTNGTVTNLSGTIGTVTTLNGTNGTITNLSGTIGTVTTLSSTNGTVTNLSSTNLSGTIGTVTTLQSTNGTITNLNSTNLSGTIGTVTNFNSTNLSGTIGTITTLNSTKSNLTNVSVSGITTFTNTTQNTLGNPDTGAVQIDGGLGVNKNATIDGSLDVDGQTELDDVNVSGIATIQDINVQNTFDVYASTAVFHNDVSITGNLSIGGTATTLQISDLQIVDTDIILGVTTGPSGEDLSTDITANHGGIAVASTEGNPLVDLFIVGLETSPATYKKFMWFREGTFSGLNTDAWLSNYAIGIGSTQFATGTRLAAGQIQITENTISSPQLSISGVSTFSGDIDADGDLDVDGHTELDDVNVAGVSTFAGAIDANGGLDVSGGSGLIASSAAVSDLTSGRVVLAGTSGELEDSGNLTFDGSTLNVIGHSELDNVNISGVSTFTGDIDANGGLDVDGHTELDDVNITGVATIGNVIVGGATTDLLVNGNARITGILTIGTGSITIDSATNFIGIGTNVPSGDSNSLSMYSEDSDPPGAGSFRIAGPLQKIVYNGLDVGLLSGTYSGGVYGLESANANSLVRVGILSATASSSLGVATANSLQVNGIGTITGDAFVGSAITMYASAGIVSATSFFGDGSGLSNTGSTLSTLSGTERVVLTNLTSGTMTASSTDANLTFNSDGDVLQAGAAVTVYGTAGIVSATSFFGDGSGLSNTGSTLSDLSGTERIVLTSLTSGTMTSSSTDSNLTFNSTGDVLQAGVAVTVYGTAGIVSATSFFGDGSGLSNTGSTLSATSGTERVVLTNLTSGTMTASSTDADLTFDSVSNTLLATNLSVSGIATATTIDSSTFKNYAETVTDLGTLIDGTNGIDLSNGNVFYGTLPTSGTVTFTFTTGLTAGAVSFTLYLKNGASGTPTLAWPAAVKFPGGSAPDRTTTADKTDIWTFSTFNNGTDWYGDIAMYNL